MTNYYVLTAYNTDKGTVYSLIDREGKLTEPRFLQRTAGFTSEDTSSVGRAISKTRSRAKARIAKMFGNCEVFESKVVDIDTINQLNGEFLDASRRFGKIEEVKEETADTNPEAQLAWCKIANDWAELTKKAESHEDDKSIIRKTGYLLEVKVRNNDEESKLYFGRYNGVGTTAESLKGHTYGYPDCKYFTGKVMDIVKSWIPAIKQYGEDLGHTIEMQVIELTYKNGELTTMMHRDCSSWYNN